MRKFFFILTVILLFVIVESVNLCATEIKVGLTSANIEFSEEYSSYKAQHFMGFQAGLSLHFGLSDNLMIQPEVYYTTRGSKLNDLLDLHLNYVEMPLLVKFNIPINGKLKESLIPSIFSGGYASFRISGNLKYNNGEKKRANNMSKYDYGLVFGCSITFGKGLIKFVVDSRYIIGLANILDDHEKGEFYRNKAFVIMIGISYKSKAGT